MVLTRQGRQVSSSVLPFLPLFLRAPVVHGKKRGGKELGIPTANFPMDVVDNLPEAVSTGIYYGWASVDRGPVHKMVMSIGWNPFYNNTKKSMETHIIHTFDNDFYGAELSVVILGFIRPEKNYPSLDALIEAIHADIREAEQTLEKTENKEFASHSFFNKTESDT
ncbi:riboflavin kinase-like isoform X1 [Orbicella faveolata]|uniref:riboflavin kinase-like isoform X1 n=1 Tax=Orbicella faveolata TaxID=48498 RepID=UPI0009E40744|nr:riboflavin kinase-like isoform X1 [Orbicella faveolata]